MSVALTGGVVSFVRSGGDSPSSIVLRRSRNISLVPTGLRLSTLRLDLIGTVDERMTLGKCLGAIGSGCSCVLVSYVPSLDVVAIGTLSSTSDMVVPIRTRFLSTGNVRRLMRAVTGMGERVGPRLGVSKILFALISNEAGLTGDARSTVGFTCNGGIGVFGAGVPVTVGTTRADSGNGDVCACTPGDAMTRTCRRLAGRILKVRRERGREFCSGRFE